MFWHHYFVFLKNGKGKCFSEIIIHTTVGLIEEGLLFPEENVGLWLEFAFFGSS